MTSAHASTTHQLGKYQLVRHLASGGMADLWLARASGLEGFEHHVVIKRVRAEQAGDQRFVRMFFDEARLAASLHHDHIAAVHDIGQDGGEYFFAMEYVHGEDLRKLLTHVSAHEQYVPIEHVLTIALAVTSALHYAHEHKSQIVHRDVSPANVIVGYGGAVKVVDFGIAKAAHRTSETQSGVMKGKVAYMSPEQCVGQPVDRRSDLFSLGIVLYELLTVRRLFKGANDFLTMSAIIHGDVPPPSTIRPGIPRELEAIVMRALAPKRAERYQTADEMRRALDQFATTNQLRASSTALADYMRSLFGHRPEPWLADDEPEIEVKLDFDGALSGVVQVPQAAIERFAVPTTTPVQPSSPIMRARTRAITETAAVVPPSTEPPERAPALPDEPHGLDVAEAELASLAVGDQTAVVRVPTTVPRTRRQYLAAGAVVVVAAAICVVLLWPRLGGGDQGAAEDHARPDIRLPPPTKVPDPLTAAPTEPPPLPDRPVATAVPDAAVDTVTAIEADAAVEPETDPDDAAVIDDGAKLPERDRSGARSRVRKKKKKRGRPTRDPAPPTPPPDNTWDPNTLFPKQ